jgi:hypothetical protein
VGLEDPTAFRPRGSMPGIRGDILDPFPWLGAVPPLSFQFMDSLVFFLFFISSRDLLMRDKVTLYYLISSG